jgi:hypothetical protein
MLGRGRHRHSKSQHRLEKRHEGRQWRTVEMVDRSGTAHFLRLAAAENGQPRGRYTAVCREEILSGALVARMARWCPLCVPVPTHRGAR